MAGRPRTTFDKLQRERARQEKQAAKRARRQGTSLDGSPFGPSEREPRNDEEPAAEPGPAN